MAMNLRCTLSFLFLSSSIFGTAYALPTTDAAIARPPLSISNIPPDPFPRPDVLADQVGFWRSVYGHWSSRQVALHDLAYPGIIYEVIDLPGEVGEGYTPVQKKFIEEHRTALQTQLQSLAQRYTTPSQLSDAERELLFRIRSVAGDEAVVGAAERVRSQRGMRERFRRGIEISGRYDATFRRIFSDAGLPTDLALLPHVESSFQTNARSSAGAVGVWQFTRGAGRIFLKMNSAVDERLDPVASARGAARYLGHAHNMLGNWAFSVTSYNHGIQGMLRAKKQVGDDFAQAVRTYQSRSFGFASKNFYTEFLAARDVANNPQDYFVGGVRLEPPLELHKIVLERKMSAGQLAKLHEVSLTQLAELNPAWSRRAARGELPLPVGVDVWLPAKAQPDKRSPATVATLVSALDMQSEAAPMPASIVRKYHVVRRHDTLSGIAARYRMEVAALLALNNRAPGNKGVRLGEKLLVAGPARRKAAQVENKAEIIHIVRKGETLFEIASKYGVPVAKLLGSNDLTRHSVIRPGQRFRIPR